MQWDNLINKDCPRCGKGLEEFVHLNVWKCECGFRISDYRLKEIQDSMDGSEEATMGFSSGFGFNQFDDDPPF